MSEFITQQKDQTPADYSPAPSPIRGKSTKTGGETSELIEGNI